LGTAVTNKISTIVLEGGGRCTSDLTKGYGRRKDKGKFPTKSTTQGFGCEGTERRGKT